MYKELIKSISSEFYVTPKNQRRYEERADADESLLGLTAALNRLAMRATLSQCRDDLSDRCMIGITREIVALVSRVITTPSDSFPMLAAKYAALDAALRAIEPSPPLAAFARTSLQADCMRLIAMSFLPQCPDDAHRA
jgi:hypothetical protein